MIPQPIYVQEADAAATAADAAVADAAPRVVARDAGYRRGAYRSFEFATFSARAGAVTAVMSTEHAPERDLLLAVAGLVEPTEGSLAVCGTELARRAGARAAWGRRHARLGAGTVGIGSFAAAAPVDAALTVEEAVAHERALAPRGAELPDLLGYLALFQLATHVDQRVGALAPAAAGRLSAAVACARLPQVAVVDLADEACARMDAREGACVVRDLARAAREVGCALVVGATEPACALAADAYAVLDLEAAAALDAARALADVPAHSGAPGPDPVASTQEGDAR